MKLFKSLLVAPAALSLLAPIAAGASEVNLNDISNYSDVESIDFANSFDNEESKVPTLIAGGEGLVDSHSHDGSFSETTTASFSADFVLGAVDDTPTADTGDTGEGSQSLMAAYGFQIDLNTSFTGEDSLDISIDAGNASGEGYAEFDSNSTGDALTVDGVSYSFPLGDKTTVLVGDNTDGSALFTTACAYGGPSNTLDDCGNVNAGITNGGAMLGAAYDFGNGFTLATGYAGPETGLMTEESLDAYGVNAAYTGDNYGVSVTYGTLETSTTEEDTFTAFNAYYTPEGFPSISVGYETGEDGSVTTSADGLESFFVGLTWDEVGPGSAGIAMGTKSPTVEDSSDEYMYEAYYSYPLNDGMTITPLIYIKEDADVGEDDETGIMVKTSFSF
tara:strand:- start:411 stop:1580 length:1170 start_codon:yes stop_codon:yes gene_type:complete